MYSSSSSSSQHSAPPNNLMRYDSAPSSFLDNAAESAVGMSHHHQQSRFSGHESTNHHNQKSTLSLLRPSYGSGLNGAMDESRSHSQSNNSSSSNLIRHSSSPAGFLHHLTSETAGFSVSKGVENYSCQGGSTSGHKLSRLGSQVSFTKNEQRSLSQISEVNECVRSAPSQSRSPSGFSLSAWDDGSNSYVFSSSSGKRSKLIEDDILNGLAAIDSQAALEMASMERLLHIPQDSVPCKIRAKRGCATHPRSIAERERRTRISGKLKKLQELVPNMDKQTSYSDMLDLAVQHIKGLQNQIQKLHKELDNCTCGCKQSMQQ